MLLRNQVILNENRNFRKNYLIKNGCENYDEDFLGYRSDSGKFGFFKAVHGTKDNIEGFLKTIFDTSEDHQGIYEFIQNAIDCGASKFYMFFNEDYLAVINNGSKFTEKDLNAILNVAQSGGEEEDKIGKFGIGFKLVHRMVGESNAVLEVVNDYCGPVLFSWNNLNSLNGFLTNNNYEVKKELSGEWLLKILYTCFPCGLDEVVKGKNYENVIPFPRSEAMEMKKFINENIERYNVDISNLSEGTIFFLKLGKKKGEMLESDKKKTMDGMGYTLNTVKFLKDKKLDEIRVNEFSRKKENMQSIVGNIGDIKLHDNREMSGHYSLFYHKELDKIYKFFKQDNAQKINIYNFFPIADQRSGWNFIVHSNRFQIETSRRKLLQDNINRDIFDKIFFDLKNKIKQQDNVEEYKILYTNLLLSRLNEKYDSDDNVLKFGEKLYQLVRENIPTLCGVIVNNSKQVVIKDTNLQIPLPDLKWFYVDNNYTNNDVFKKELKKNAAKIGLRRYSLKEIIIDFNIASYIKSFSENQHNIYLKELNEVWQSITSSSTINPLEKKLFKFENLEVYSINDIGQNGELVFKDIIDLDLKQRLKKMGFVFPVFDIKKYRNLENIKINYDAIKQKIKLLLDTDLTLEERVTLLRFYKYLYKDLKVDFKFYLNNKNNLVSISEILNSDIKEVTLQDYVLNSNYLRLLKEYSLLDEVDANAIQKDKVYTRIIYPHWNDLLMKNKKESFRFFKVCIEFYKLDSNSKNMNLSSKDLNLIDFKDELLSATKIFINNKLQHLSNSELETIEQNFGVSPCKIGDISILQDEIFKNMGVRNLHYKLESINKIVFTLPELQKLINVTKKLNINIFKNFVIKKEDENFILLSGKEYKNISLKNDRFLRVYRTIEYNTKLILIPEELEKYFDVETEDVDLFFNELLDKYIIEFSDKDTFECVKTLSDTLKKKYILKLSTIRIEDFESEKEYLFDLFDLVLKFGLEKDFREKLIFNDNKISVTNLPEIKFNKYPELALRLEGNGSNYIDQLYDFFKEYDQIEKILNISYLGLDTLEEELEKIRRKKIMTRQVYTVSNMFEFRVVLLYSLITKQNYFEEFEGVLIYNYAKNEYSIKRTVRDVLRFINSLKKDSKSYLDTIELFYQNELIRGINKKNIYIQEKEYALKTEDCFITNLEEIKILKKLGYKIDDGGVSQERKNVIQKKSTSLSSDPNVLKNSLKFYANKSLKFSLDIDKVTLVYFIELYTNLKEFEGIYPIYSDNLDTVKISNCSSNATLYTIDKIDNPVFKSRVEKMIKKGELIIPYEFKDIINSKVQVEELKLTNKDVIEVVEEKINDFNPNENTQYKGVISHDNQKKYEIGYKAELYVYKKLLETFDNADIVWNNEGSRGLNHDSGKVDFEVNINGEKHYIEVKGTEAMLEAGTNSYSLSDKQIFYLRNSDKNHLIYVLGVFSNNPLFIYNSYGSDFFRKLN